MVDINEIFDDRRNVQGWVEYMEGFRLLLEFGDRETLEKIYDRTKTHQWIKHQREEVPDVPKWRKSLIKFIKDWEFSGEAAAKILVLKEGVSLNGQMIDCTPSAKMMVINKVSGFENFLFEAIADLEKITGEQEDRESKNSEGSSPPD